MPSLRGGRSFLHYNSKRSSPLSGEGSLGVKKSESQQTICIRECWFFTLLKGNKCPLITLYSMVKDKKEKTLTWWVIGKTPLFPRRTWISPKNLLEQERWPPESKYLSRSPGYRRGGGCWEGEDAFLPQTATIGLNVFIRVFLWWWICSKKPQARNCKHRKSLRFAIKICLGIWWPSPTSHIRHKDLFSSIPTIASFSP